MFVICSLVLVVVSLMTAAPERCKLATVIGLWIYFR